MDPSETVYIPEVLKAQQLQQLKTPQNLYKLPSIKKQKESSESVFQQYRETYTQLLYKVGERDYALIPEYDFKVNVVLPKGYFKDVSFHILPGPTCQVTLVLMKIEKFESLIHEILKQVKDSVHTKTLIPYVALEKKQQENTFKPFLDYGLSGHDLDMRIERTVTIEDKTTKVRVIKKGNEEEKSWGRLIHEAKVELVKLNKMTEELREKGNQNQGKHHVSHAIGS